VTDRVGRELTGEWESGRVDRRTVAAVRDRSVHGSEWGVSWYCCSFWVPNLDGEGTSVYRVLVGKPEGKGTLVRPRRRWEDNIKIDLQEVGC
jgi:hypothetical protein